MLIIEENIPLAPYTTFKIGGPARFFTRAKSENEVREAVQFARARNQKIYILGNGSNVLISDAGFDGLVIKMELQETGVDGAYLTIGAGVPMAKAAAESAKHKLAGFAWAVGVPGTVGGAVYGNAGCFGGEMKEVVEKVRVLDLSDKAVPVREFANTECEFAYRESIFKLHPEWIILKATLALQLRPEETGAEIKAITKERLLEQAIGEKTAGSTFKGIELTEDMIAHIYRHDQRWKKGHPNTCWIFENRRGYISAGFIIELAGLKKMRVGAAEVSLKHANFILNTGNATAEHVIMLIGIIKERVHRMFGVHLEEEIRYVGF